MKLLHGDCLELLPTVADGSVDLVLCDPPYGTTACAWDAVIPFEPMWAQVRRTARKNAAVVLFAAQPFAAALIMSNAREFKYEWIWEKTNPKGFFNAQRRPLAAHENVLVFSSGAPTYHPQKWSVPEHLRTKRKQETMKPSGECYGGRLIQRKLDDGSRFPTSVIGFSNRVGRSDNFHPTQKPVALMEYLIRTYSNAGDTVLDFTMGSGTTGVACVNTGRKFIGIERDPTYFAIAEERIAEASRMATDSMGVFG